MQRRVWRTYGVYMHTCGIHPCLFFQCTDPSGYQFPSVFVPCTDTNVPYLLYSWLYMYLSQTVQGLGDNAALHVCISWHQPLFFHDPLFPSHSPPPRFPSPVTYVSACNLFPCTLPSASEANNKLPKAMSPEWDPGLSQAYGKPHMRHRSPSRECQLSLACSSSITFHETF